MAALREGGFDAAAAATRVVVVEGSGAPLTIWSSSEDIADYGYGDLNDRRVRGMVERWKSDCDCVVSFVDST